MKGNMHIWYDPEGDFLEIQVGERTEGYFKDVGEGIAERIDEKTGKITGIAILSFKKRAQEQKDVRITLPVTLEITAAETA